MATIDTNHDRTKASGTKVPRGKRGQSGEGFGEIVRIYPRRKGGGVVVIRRIDTNKISRIELRDKKKIEAAKAELADARARRAESRREKPGVLEMIANVFAA